MTGSSLCNLVTTVALQMVLRKYREEYRGLARRIGVRLASEDNPGKAFPPSTRVEIFGLEYDTEAWT